MHGANAYTISRLVSDLTAGVWSELSDPKPAVDVYRRSLQRSFLRAIDRRINGSSVTSTDLKPVAKAELRALAQRIDKAIPRAANRLTALHLEESRSDIERILQARFAFPNQAASNDYFFFGIKNLDAPVDSCWDPYATIREAIREAGH